MEGGWIVEAAHPYGGDYPFGEVICKTWEEVIALLAKVANPDLPFKSIVEVVNVERMVPPTVSGQMPGVHVGGPPPGPIRNS